jgi:CHAD domain-containing protein
MQSRDINVGTTEAFQLDSVMPRSTKSMRKPVSASRPTRKPRSPSGGPLLNPAMPCDTAFRIVARRHLERLSANHTATCSGDQDALHQMRVALTHLRTCVRFFSPMVEDPARAEITDELKWLNKQLGVVRDLDVAIGRIETTTKTQDSPRFASWKEKRTKGHRALARTLRSARYRRLLKSTSKWIESGPWSTRPDEQSEQARRIPVLVYALHKLAQWEKRLLKRSRKLHKMDVEKRHRLRLLNKKLNYAIESCQDLFADARFAKQETALKNLRKAQRYLGQLNDDARQQVLARELRRDGAKTPLPSRSPGREALLLEKTAAVYAKLAKLQPFRS